MEYKHRITVFTPTYNRAYIIEKLYNSLKRQNYVDFEWLVVDDGSSDNTEDLFKIWRNENNPFTIRYYKTENGGKHRAINVGLDLADGEIFFTVDSDDELTNDALFKINQWFEQIADNDEIQGIVANRGYSESETINNYFLEDYMDAYLSDMHKLVENGKNVLDGERAIAFYTDFHKKYKFPEFDGEKFMTEAVVYNRMSHDNYKMRFFNDIIWIYEYHSDGLTKAGTKLFINNPKGYGLWIKEKNKFEKNSLLRTFITKYQFVCDLMNYWSCQVIAEAFQISRIEVRLLESFHVVGAWLKGH